MFENENTQSIPVNDPRFQAMLSELDDSQTISSLLTSSELLFRIDDMTVNLTVQDGKVYYLGRFKENSDNELDLTPYGALQKGVSRIHAKLLLEEDKLYIVDLNSSNGTYVRRQRLHPNEPAVLNSGDEILLARMKIQISFI